MGIDWVPAMPTDELAQRAVLQELCAALREHRCATGCMPRFAVLHLAEDERTLARIEFDEVECGV